MSDPLWGTEGSAPDDSGAEPASRLTDVPADRRADPAPQKPAEKPAEQPAEQPARTPAAKKREPEPVPDWLKSEHGPDPKDPKDRDPVAVVAVVCGFVGIVVLGLLLAVVTAVLGAWAGQRARESGRTYELPFLAIGLAVADAVVFVIIQSLVEAPQWLG